jgi:hypothetical protein
MGVRCMLRIAAKGNRSGAALGGNSAFQPVLPTGEVEVHARLAARTDVHSDHSQPDTTQRSRWCISEKAMVPRLHYLVQSVLRLSTARNLSRPTSSQLASLNSRRSFSSPTRPLRASSSKRTPTARVRVQSPQRWTVLSSPPASAEAAASAYAPAGRESKTATSLNCLQGAAGAYPSPLNSTRSLVDAGPEAVVWRCSCERTESQPCS